MTLWQLKKISTGEILNSPQKLPENWGPIFGMAGVTDKLGDLSWLGEQYNDTGWFAVGQGPDDAAQSSVADIEWEKAKRLLKDSDWAVLSDVPMSAGEKTQWIEFRRALREIKLQSGFPTEVIWPSIPS